MRKIKILEIFGEQYLKDDLQILSKQKYALPNEVKPVLAKTCLPDLFFDFRTKKYLTVYKTLAFRRGAGMNSHVATGV